MQRSMYCCGGMGQRGGRIWEGEVAWGMGWEGEGAAVGWREKGWNRV